MTATRCETPGPGPEVLRGWGRTHRATSLVAHPRGVRELADTAGSSRFTAPLVARGGGCSYGDAATCSGGTVLDLSGCRRVVEFDRDTGRVVAEAGLTVGELGRLVAPYGWAVPVLPGTPHVSLGGAVAADVHGKNHMGAGSFGRHVLWVVVARPDLSPRRLVPQVCPEEFWATVGGMGLTGPILLVALQLRPAGLGPAVTTRRRGDDLACVMELMDTVARQQRGNPRLHVVAWLDGAAPAACRGRGLVQITRTPARSPGAVPRTCRPRHAPPSGLPLPDGGALRAGSGPGWSGSGESGSGWFGDVPSLPGRGVMTRQVISVLNRARWLVPADGRPHLEDADRALNPLRWAGPWPALFGRAGLVQYQFAVPDEAAALVGEALALLAEHRLPPALATLKRLGPPVPAPLSFPLDGWTLALDFPARWTGLEPTLAELDALVAGARGRVYLAKDSRLGAAQVERMYPRLRQWQQVRDGMDPEGLFASDLSRRLRLTPCTCA